MEIPVASVCWPCRLDARNSRSRGEINRVSIWMDNLKIACFCSADLAGKFVLSLKGNILLHAYLLVKQSHLCNLKTFPALHFPQDKSLKHSKGLKWLLPSGKILMERTLALFSREFVMVKEAVQSQRRILLAVNCNSWTQVQKWDSYCPRSSPGIWFGFQNASHLNSSAGLLKSPCKSHSVLSNLYYSH